MPGSTLTFQNDTRRGSKKSKERITCLLTCSMAGEKKKILVVGKSKNPRCFKNVNPLTVDYEANSNSWMTRGIWESFLRAWDKDLKKKNRKILLLADNCSAHTQVTGLSSIRVKFLPPNTTSVLQPCDMGIIRAVKAIFRKAMCRQVLQQMDESVTTTTSKLAKKITLLDGILLMKASWEEIDSVTIKNCWVKSGLKMGSRERPAHTSQLTAVPSVLPMNQKQWEDFFKLMMTWRLHMLLMRMKSWILCELAMKKKTKKKKKVMTMQIRNLFKCYRHPQSFECSHKGSVGTRFR